MTNGQEDAALVTPTTWKFGDQVADVDRFAASLTILSQLGQYGFTKRAVGLDARLDSHHVLVLRLAVIRWFTTTRAQVGTRRVY